MPRKLKDKDKELVVAQDNKLIQKISTDNDYDRNLTKQSFVLDVYQKRLLALMISHIPPNAIEFPVEEISFYNFMQFMNISDGGKQYKKIHSSISKLMGMSFVIEPKPGVYEFYHWIAGGCRVDEHEKKIYIQLDPGLKKFLTGTQRNFTRYEIGFIMQLKKKYSCRLYEYLRSMVNLGCVNLNVDTFSKVITDDKYPRMADQKRYVIDPAIEEINETTDITVSCEEVRKKTVKGKYKTVGYKFHIQEKTLEEKQIIMGTWGIPFDDILIEYDGNTRPQFNKGNEEKLELPFTFDDED